MILRTIGGERMGDDTEIERLERMAHDLVNAPSHYRAGDVYETIRVIEAWKLTYNLGNYVKYISRAGRKDALIQDLEKARWYLDREIANHKKGSATVDASHSRSQESGV